MHRSKERLEYEILKILFDKPANKTDIMYGTKTNRKELTRYMKELHSQYMVELDGKIYSLTLRGRRVVMLMNEIEEIKRKLFNEN